jgi:hypothetical protein
MTVFGTGPTRGVDRPADEAANRAYADLLRVLVNLRTVSEIRFTLLPEAHDVRERLWNRVEAVMQMPKTLGALKNHLVKREALFARLLLTMHIVETLPLTTLFGCALPEEISGETALRVEQLMLEYLLPNAIRLYRELYGRDDHAQHACWIAGHILAHRLPRIGRRDIYRAYHDLRGDDQALDRAMRHLEIAGWIVRMTRERGKPASQWWVDPRIHQQFAERAEHERVRRRNEVERAGRASAKLGRVANQVAA